MTDQDITFSLPLTIQEFWVLTLALALIGLSVLTFHLGRQRSKTAQQTGDWLAQTLVVFSGILAPIWAALIFLVLYGLWRLTWSFPSISDGTNLRWHVLALVGLLTALAGLLGTPLAMIRVSMTERQTNAVEQGHITDRINKAVEGLGAEKVVKRQRKNNFGEYIFEKLADGELDYSKPVMEDVTEPNLEVRIGALFALERISQDSARDHIQIMEILCAYIVNNADRHSPALPAEQPNEGWVEWGKEKRTQPPLDVDTALKIIKRRSDSRKALETKAKYRLGLERAPLHTLDLSGRDLTGAILIQAQLQGANLSHAQLQGANLSEAQLQGANLSRAQLQGANLSDAQLQGADLSDAQLQGANLWKARLQGARLWNAQLQGANLSDAQLQGADLSDAQLQGANLWKARLQGARLWNAQLQGADLRAAQLQGADLPGANFDNSTQTWAADFTGAACRGVDFTDCDISLNKLQTAFGDGATTLPGGHGPDHPNWPVHWRKEKLDYKEFNQAWRAWQAEIGFQPPKNP